ncbi:MAG: UTP--glucose-1-phosphate uridylyltransferase [Brevinematia bacterium]
MKALIISAGYGSRFLPITKTIPKEMLPLYNIPSIHFSINEIIEAGIKDIIIVTSRRKKSLDDYFDVEFELESFFKGTEKEKIILPPNANICFVRQKRMLGVGNAIIEASSFIGNDPFILLYPDDIVISKPSLSKKLVEIFKSSNKNVISIIDKSGEDLQRFGVAKVRKINNLFEVNEIVEKPAKGKEPSSYVTIGRYLFTPEFMKFLKEDWEKFNGKGEFYHIDAINKLCREGKVLGIEVKKEEFFDTGTPIEYSKSFVRYILEQSELKEEFRSWLKNYIQQI